MRDWPLPVLKIGSIHHDVRAVNYTEQPLGMRDDSHRVHEASAEE